MNQYFKHAAIMLLVMLAMVLCSASPSFAQAATGADTCTDFASLYEKAKTPEPGLLTNITGYVKEVVGTATKQLYQAFTNSTAYKNAVGATITLMVVIFGVGFLVGVVQASFGQVLIRLVKIGIILTLISPGGWQFFSDYAVKFFNGGTDYLISVVMQIGTGVKLANNESPFRLLDGLATVILSPDMIIATLGAIFNSGPYGLAMGGLMGFGVAGLIKLLIDALKVYAIAFVVRSLMLGVAPIFIVFLLFDKTKALFTGWLNVMIFLSLHPILFFTFISFFLVMLTTASTNMMGGNELCWTQYKGVQGSQNKASFWRFKSKDGKYAEVDDYDWKGPISCALNGGKDVKTGKECPPFPLNIVDVLSFLILVFVAGKFGQVTERIASDISGSYANLDAQARGELSKLNNNEKQSSANPPAGGQRVGRK
ncbi:MAG: type IV secretion system protein [Rickettsiales bacterium]|nr:type IV secretion system protein [Rickettsiales bacterium]